eukprot:TRINITY_DN9741_c1_g3_i1.p1 TRINITY_DN9741_c1_g3~~TRINITY_DN9741_c1_g3_i1.p1  ORF type:complete len:252 (+),score=50.74 TRINITY_DN9741_c1_g3_i1:222-977(+)
MGSSSFRTQLLTATSVTSLVLFVLNFATGPTTPVIHGSSETAPRAVRKLKNPRVEMDIAGFGTVEIELFRQRKPKTVDNFLQYINDGFYDGLIFHRVMKGFMIQTGDRSADGTKAVVKYPTLFPENENFIPNKPYVVISYFPHLSSMCTRVVPLYLSPPLSLSLSLSLSLCSYTLAVARAGLKGNSQFFINLVHNTHLDNENPPFVVFGEVSTAEGRRIIDKVQQVPVVDKGGELSTAEPPVVITSMKVKG